MQSLLRNSSRGLSMLLGGALALTSVAVMSLSTVSAQSGFLYEGYNTAGVQNGPPPNPTVASLPSGATITMVATYHWNYGQGTVPGTITLVEQSSRSTYGPFQAVGDNGQ